MTGIWSSTFPANSSVQGILNNVKAQTESMLSKKYTKFNAISYKSQGMDYGWNYIIKCETSEGYIHIKIKVTYDNQSTVLQITQNKTLSDLINVYMM